MWTWWLPSLYFRMHDAYQKDRGCVPSSFWARSGLCPRSVRRGAWTRAVHVQENIDGRTFKQYLTYHFNYWMASGPKLELRSD